MNSTFPTLPAGPAYSGDCLRHLPLAAQQAFARYQTEHDPAALDAVMLAILEHFACEAVARSLTELPGSTRLQEDLGFDSLTLAEVVFFTEDLLAINITNPELVPVRTLDDLRGFIRRKVAGAPLAPIVAYV